MFSGAEFSRGLGGIVRQAAQGCLRRRKCTAASAPRRDVPGYGNLDIARPDCPTQGRSPGRLYFSLSNKLCDVRSLLRSDCRSWNTVRIDNPRFASKRPGNYAMRRLRKTVQPTPSYHRPHKMKNRAQGAALDNYLIMGYYIMSLVRV